MKLILEMLEKYPIKIPAPIHDQMMQMFQELSKETCANINNKLGFKKNIITLALDGTEDHFASTKFMDVIVKEIPEFRKQFLSSKPAATKGSLYTNH